MQIICSPLFFKKQHNETLIFKLKNALWIGLKHTRMKLEILLFWQTVIIFCRQHIYRWLPKKMITLFTGIKDILCSAFRFFYLTAKFDMISCQIWCQSNMLSTLRNLPPCFDGKGHFFCPQDFVRLKKLYHKQPRISSN